MTQTQEEYESVRAALIKAGFSEADTLRFIVKPTRQYTKDQTWKEEGKGIYEETGIITRLQIKSTKGFPTNSNPSQTVSRFIIWLEKQTGHTLTEDKKTESWAVKVDHSKLFDELAAKIHEGPRKIKPFLKKHNISNGYRKELEDRGCEHKEGPYDGTWGRA